MLAKWANLKFHHFSKQMTRLGPNLPIQCKIASKFVNLVTFPFVKGLIWIHFPYPRVRFWPSVSIAKGMVAKTRAAHPRQNVSEYHIPIRNCSQMNAFGLNWSVNSGSYNGLVPSGNSHYLRQCWPRSMSPYGVIRPKWLNLFAHGTCGSNVKNTISNSLYRLISWVYNENFLSCEHYRIHAL